MPASTLAFLVDYFIQCLKWIINVSFSKQELSRTSSTATLLTGADELLVALRSHHGCERRILGVPQQAGGQDDGSGQLQRLHHGRLLHERFEHLFHHQDVRRLLRDGRRTDPLRYLDAGRRL